MNEELIAQLQQGVGSAELSAEVCQAIGIDRAVWEIADGSKAYDVTRSLDATEPLMRERFWRITEQGHDGGWDVWGQKEPGIVGDNAQIFGSDAHACARCLVLLAADVASENAIQRERSR